MSIYCNACNQSNPCKNRNTCIYSIISEFKKMRDNHSKNYDKSLEMIESRLDIIEQIFMIFNNVEIFPPKKETKNVIEFKKLDEESALKLKHVKYLRDELISFVLSSKDDLVIKNEVISKLNDVISFTKKAILGVKVDGNK